METSGKADSFTKIRDIKEGMKGLLVKGKVSHKGPIDMRSQSKAHAMATLTDETGEILLNLWRDQIEQVQTDDSIILRLAFVRKYKGNLELSLWGNVEKETKSRGTR
jgi:ssDNA-binding replication factor A large subunit